MQASPSVQFDDVVITESNVDPADLTLPPTETIDITALVEQVTEA